MYVWAGMGLSLSRVRYESVSADADDDDADAADADAVTTQFRISRPQLNHYTLTPNVNSGNTDPNIYPITYTNT